MVDETVTPINASLDYVLKYPIIEFEIIAIFLYLNDTVTRIPPWDWGPQDRKTMNL